MTLKSSSVGSRVIKETDSIMFSFNNKYINRQQQSDDQYEDDDENENENESDEVWDDSSLINAYDQAINDYINTHSLYSDKPKSNNNDNNKSNENAKKKQNTTVTPTLASASTSTSTSNSNPNSTLKNKKQSTVKQQNVNTHVVETTKQPQSTWRKKKSASNDGQYQQPFDYHQYFYQNQPYKVPKQPSYQVPINQVPINQVPINQFPEYYNQPHYQPTAVLPPPPPFPPLPPGLEMNDELGDLLLSWYYSGYYTGIYQEKKRQREQATSNNK